MTQTGDGSIWQVRNSIWSKYKNSQSIIYLQVNLPQTYQPLNNTINDYSDLYLTNAMTCQELLAFSGAFSAALPAGNSTLESFYTTLLRSNTNDNNNTSSNAMATTISKNQHNQDHYALKPANNATNILYPTPTPTAMQQSNTNYNNEDFSCCYELYQNAYLMDSRYDTKKRKNRSKIFIVILTIYRVTRKVLYYIRRFMKAIVDHKYFQQGILLAILINTLSMGIEYHDQPEELTAIVETSNIVFSIIFAVEMMLKIIADGPFKYVSNGFNVFDGVIVILR